MKGKNVTQSSLAPDAVVNIRLRTAEEGGRASDLGISSANPYGCPMYVEGRYFDCRWLLLDGQLLQLGAEYSVPLKFLSADLVAPFLMPGRAIQMWDGKVIADGVIESLCG